ncbi:MAG: DUF1080 domain-containing protein [Spirosomataceae bacterium]|jgi:hypothetical protein
MKNLSNRLWVLCLFLSVVSHATAQKSWISLFDGSTLNGWKVGENPQTFSVEDGAIKVAGPRSHLYYMGEVSNHEFKNFELKARVKTTKGSNSGIYFHTRYQEKGWPIHGYEVQINNTHGDYIKTGSLYEVVDVREVFVKDEEWFTLHIIVKGNHVIVKINDTVVVDYTQPTNPLRVTEERQTRVIKPGTFAIQGHDPKSVVYLKDIQVKLLKD